MCEYLENYEADENDWDDLYDYYGYDDTTVEDNDWGDDDGWLVIEISN